MKKLAVASIIGLSLGLSGCVISVDGDGEYSHHSDWQHKEQKNRKHISRLQQNDTYNEIISRMGLPDFNEFYTKGDDAYQVVYYRTQRIEGDGVTTKDECTPMIFKNGALIGWGESAYKVLGQ